MCLPCCMSWYMAGIACVSTNKSVMCDCVFHVTNTHYMHCLKTHRHDDVWLLIYLHTTIKPRICNHLLQTASLYKFNLVNNKMSTGFYHGLIHNLHVYYTGRKLPVLFLPLANDEIFWHIISKLCLNFEVW